MGYQIITKMVYNARTHQIETWQHSNNVWPRTDHFRVLDVRTDEQLFRFITMVAEGSWQTRSAVCRKYEELAGSKCSEITARFRQLAKIKKAEK